MDSVLAQNAGRRFVSTGQLPDRSWVAALVREAHQRASAVDSGRVSQVYPALAAADPALLGVALVAVDGSTHVAGDAAIPFSLMSVAKPFVLALACDLLGTEPVLDRTGADPTGERFDSLDAVDRHDKGRTNPMVNSGAITCAGLLHEHVGSQEETWEQMRRGLGEFAGRDLRLDSAVYHSASSTNLQNRAIAARLHARGALSEPRVALDLYTRQSSLAVTALDLAVMGATLADGGVNPLTGRRVVSADAAAVTLAVMATCGMYEASGRWLARVRLPAKSGISGAMVTAAPGKGGLGTYAPPLDPAGNSVRGSVCAEFLGEALGLDLFTANPAPIPQVPSTPTAREVT